MSRCGLIASSERSSSPRATYRRVLITLLGRLALVGAVVAGLVAMHGLASSGHCGDGQHVVTAATESGTAPGPAHPPGSSRQASLPASPSSSAVVIGGGGAERGMLDDVLCACLALLATAGSLLALTLLAWVRRTVLDRVPRPRALIATAPARGPPLPRRLAALQVLRL